jgi:hypothetical protein
LDHVSISSDAYGSIPMVVMVCAHGSDGVCRYGNAI